MKRFMVGIEWPGFGKHVVVDLDGVDAPEFDGVDSQEFYQRYVRPALVALEQERKKAMAAQQGGGE